MIASFPAGANDPWQRRRGFGGDLRTARRSLVLRGEWIRVSLTLETVPWGEKNQLVCVAVDWSNAEGRSTVCGVELSTGGETRRGRVTDTRRGQL